MIILSDHFHHCLGPTEDSYIATLQLAILSREAALWGHHHCHIEFLEEEVYAQAMGRCQHTSSC